MGEYVQNVASQRIDNGKPMNSVVNKYFNGIVQWGVGTDADQRQDLGLQHTYNVQLNLISF